MKPLRYLLALLLAAVGLRAADKKPDFDPSVVLKIIIRADGTVLADGVSTKLAEVPAKLTALSEKKGVVWFYRANPEGEPPPNSMEVLKMVIDARRPIQLFTKEDFSETVGPDGKPKKMK
ncbi:MAG: hypothetical protein WC718_16450 [Phycisphaerales bacterium]|jgi:hypothetical protein